MSSIESHTPGPWRICHNDYCSWISNSLGKAQIAKVFEPAGMGPEISAANARLIASAPELLDFAEIVARSACLQQVNQGRCICFACEAGRLVAKAQGGQSCQQQERRGPRRHANTDLEEV